MYTIPLGDFFTTVADKGIHRLLVEDIRKAHRDFHGEWIAIRPNVLQSHSLEKWQRIWAWLTFRRGHEYSAFALANLLAVIAQRHNFTFHTLDIPEDTPYCLQGELVMESDVGNGYGTMDECFAASVSLFKVKY